MGDQAAGQGGMWGNVGSGVRHAIYTAGSTDQSSGSWLSADGAVAISGSTFVGSAIGWQNQTLVWHSSMPQVIPDDPAHKSLVALIVRRLNHHIKKALGKLNVDVATLTPADYVDHQRVAFTEGVLWAMENIPQIAEELKAKQERQL